MNSSLAMNQSNGLMGRRRFLNLTGSGGMTLMAAVMGSALWNLHSDQAIALSEHYAIASPPEPLSPDAALQKLMDGNKRFMQHKGKHPDQSQARMKEVAQVQHPFATVLCCADSRVPPEILFDE